MTKYLLLILTLFMFSCSTTEKQLKKAIERHGAKESAAYLSINYPEYLEPRTVTIDTIIRDTVLVAVPEYSFDTLYIPSDSCKEFHYMDNRLRIDVKNGNVSYKIREVKVPAPVEVPVYIEKDCPPCPTLEVVNEVKEKFTQENNKLKSELAEAKSWPKWVWFCIVFTFSAIAGGLVYGYLKLKP